MHRKQDRSKLTLTARFVSMLAVFALATPAYAEPVSARTDPVRTLVKRLDLQRYKATIKSLTEFGDRRQGTSRNRAAIYWIETQLKSYGCTNTERLKYTFGDEPVHRIAPAAAPVAVGSDEAGRAAGGGRPRGFARPTGVNMDPNAQPDARASWTHLPPSPERVRKSIAPKSVPAIRKKCTSSLLIWTASALAKPPTTTLRELRWLWNWLVC
jgi:hypothetical protein